MATTNTQVLLASRPVGWVTEENFRIVETPTPVPGDGQALVRNRWLSLDPVHARPDERGEVLRSARRRSARS